MIDQESQGADEEMLALVGDAFDSVHLEQNAEEVMSRGRTLRRRKRAMPALVGIGIVAASLSLSLPLRAGGATVAPSAGKPLTYNGAAVNVDEAGFSVHTDAATGTVTVTINQLFDPAGLTAILAKAGVRANTQILKATMHGNRAYYSGCKLPSGVRGLTSPGFEVSHSDANVFVIHPAALPAGSVLEFMYEIDPLHPSKMMGVEFALLSADPGPCVPAGITSEALVQ